MTRKKLAIVSICILITGLVCLLVRKLVGKMEDEDIEESFGA